MFLYVIVLQCLCILWVSKSWCNFGFSNFHMQSNNFGICNYFQLRVVLLDWTFKIWGHSNFAFQHCQGFIGNLNKKNFWNPVRRPSKFPSQDLKKSFCIRCWKAKLEWTHFLRFNLVKWQCGLLEIISSIFKRLYKRHELCSMTFF